MRRLTVTRTGLGARLMLVLALAVSTWVSAIPAEGQDVPDAQTLPPGTIVTVAGNGGGAYTGDGVPATQTSLYYPVGVSVGNDGSIYIGDNSNQRVRRVRPDGIIETFAGLGVPLGISVIAVPGFVVGDGGPASQAILSHPAGVEADPNGNIYIVDNRGQRIRKVDPSGTISSIAGNGSWGYSGDGGMATSAQLYYPNNVAFDSAGNVYIADHYNHRIRKVDPSGIITTVAGKGTLGFSGDGGLATDAELAFPDDVAVDARGNLYIADHYNNRIRKVDTSGIISTIAGTGTAGFSGDGDLAVLATFNAPLGVLVTPDGSLLVVDSQNDRIRRIDPSGRISTVAGSGEQGAGGDNGPAIEAELFQPSTIAMDGAGNLFIADSANNKIRRVSGPLW